jgi:hypothetical protein
VISQTIGSQELKRVKEDMNGQVELLKRENELLGQKLAEVDKKYKDMFLVQWAAVKGFNVPDKNEREAFANFIKTINRTLPKELQSNEDYHANE